MTEELKNYFDGDILAAQVWLDKYADIGEKTPEDMHKRMAKEFARIEKSYNTEKIGYGINLENLSTFGQYYTSKRGSQSLQDIEKDIFQLLDKFKHIVPQGSIMSVLGTKTIGSLSNCYVIPSPLDSYSGILKTDEELVQLMKRRAGVGTCLDSLRPGGAFVNNVAKTSTGADSFMDRYSNTTREVAQEGRRGALMLLMSCNHPSIFKFVTKKKDRTKVTGANVSVMFTNKFMKTVEADEDFLCTFPVDWDFSNEELYACDYNVLTTFHDYDGSKKLYMKIRARELWELVIEMAWENAEPGIAFKDRVINYSPESVYELFIPIACNPCFHPDTLISTVKGQMKIKDIAEPIEVYSMTESGELVIRKASCSFITESNAKTLKITLRSGNSITVTPNHKLFVQNKGWVEAKDLTTKDRIVHLSRSRRGAKYAGVYLTSEDRNSQRMEHRLVYEGVKGTIPEGYDVHHKDENTYNNHIDNLELLSHSDHAIVTATEQNPQNHQVRNFSGRFVTHDKSKHGAKDYKPIPDNLKTNMKNQFSNLVLSIEEGETCDVYDITVEDTHCLLANNMVAHNCGEQWLNAYDSCRLFAQNLFSIVKDAFTDNSHVDYDLLYEISYIQQVLADNLIDLELERVQAIISKIKSDPEPEDIKQRELTLWENVYKVCKAGRRTGCGITALGDMIAALGLVYDSEEGMKVINSVMKIKMKAELDATIDLAILRGTFEGWNSELEYNIDFQYDEFDIEHLSIKGENQFYSFIAQQFPKQVERLIKYGRRNISWSTIAPTGTVSLMTQTSSGCEPLFKAYYIRRTKVNPNEDKRVDFVDQNGDSWTEYPVLHPKFRDWIKEKSKASVLIDEMSSNDIKSWFEESPWFGSQAEDIDWIKRIEIQAILQKYTTNAISSTINLPNSATKEQVGEIYLQAYKQGLKGVTVYRDGCRTGVLVSEPTVTTDEFGYINAVKRPKEIDGELNIVSVKGDKYGVLVGLIDNKPYEVFAFHANGEDLPAKNVGKIIKVKKGQYDFKSDEGTLRNIQHASIKTDEQVLTRLISGMLRHGTEPKYIIEQISKCDLEISSFGKAVSRVLKKYIAEGAKSTVSCEDCGSNEVIFEEGCRKCKNCGASRC